MREEDNALQIGSCKTQTGKWGPDGSRHPSLFNSHFALCNLQCISHDPMLNLEFLFSAALWALPLASIPIILHLLFKRKSPVIKFSTIRFLKASLQQTAARKKVQRWLLLACRALLLALLIAAVAQPQSRPTALWSASPQSLAAAIVVDTSYSMQLRADGTPLINKANSMVQQLLAGQLHDANVAIFRSSPADVSDPEQKVLRDQETGGIASHLTWTPLVPQPAAKPLIDRIPAALEFLHRSGAADQRLIVISDFQQRDFPHGLPEFEPARALLIDLHPRDPRSDGVTRISTEPARPTPGIGSEVIVEVAGKPNSEPLVSLTIESHDGRSLFQSAALGAKIDSSGFGRAKFPVRLPSERWTILKATLANEDDMPWDNSRMSLLEIPPRQIVTLLHSDDFPSAGRIVKLALDPSEGTSTAWPVIAKLGTSIAPDSSVAVALLGKWPDVKQAETMQRFVQNGGTLVWFIRPGLQATWPKLPDAQKTALLALLPAEPVPDATEVASSAGVTAMSDPLLTNLTEARYQIGGITVQRYVPFSTARQFATPLLSLFPIDPATGARSYGLLFRRAVGTGTVFTFSTIPSDQYTNLATHPIFLPLLVRMALRPPGAGEELNAELGQSISVGGHAFDRISDLWIHSPDGGVFPANAVPGETGRRFYFDHANAPGLCTWTRPNEADVVALTNVQPPATESQLVYRLPETLAKAGANVVIAHSLEDLAGKIASMSEPSPRWSIPIAIVMVLLCFEALMGSTSGLWKFKWHPRTAPA
jgi:hypothetical protein